jgi:hypothetical protein
MLVSLVGNRFNLNLFFLFVAVPSMKNNLQQPGAMNGQNPLAALVPCWTGSVNPADFAFSMSEKEMAELNRFRQVCDPIRTECLTLS